MSLATLNVGLDTYKWHLTVQSVHRYFSFKSSAIGTLLGLAAALVTPGRVGEYFGRLWAIPKDLHPTGLFLVFITQFAQMAVTIWGGILGFLILAELGQLPEHLLFLTQAFPKWLLLLGSFGVALVCTMMVLRPDVFLRRLHFLNPKYQAFYHTIVLIPKRIFGIGLWVSVLRYCIFLLQYGLLFSEAANISVVVLSSLVALMFLIKSVIPGVAIAELGIRSSIALWVLGQANLSPGAILFITGLIYLINQVLPAIAGWAIGIRIKSWWFCYWCLILCTKPTITCSKAGISGKIL